ncbi:MAG: LacI family DNA-binding transcriptional regulator [Propionicimonas sp.]|nr:LacI family DNA-binding transcriptional regulator [Propionicimonas sp.]
MATVAVTLHDVAREAGVSLATASRVLNGSTRRVADSYRERVQAAAEKLGYTANLSAQATARGTAATVALLVSDIADPYFGQIAAGVARGADEAGLVMTIAVTDRNPEREARHLHALRGQRPRGLILASTRTIASAASPELQRELDGLAALGGRVVAIGRGAPGLREIPVDNRGGTHDLGRALAGQGYRRAIVLAAQEGLLSSDDRVEGFTAGFTEGGGTVLRVHRGSFTREDGEQSMRAALAAGIEPGTVVFAASDIAAIGAMAAIRDAGREVGTDIALAGFDDIQTSRDVTPALSTVRVPLEEIGYLAFRAAIEPDWKPYTSTTGSQVLLRDSTPGLA